MTEKMILDAYARIRTIDQTIPDDVLDFMKDASIEKLKQVNNNNVLADVSGRSELLIDFIKFVEESGLMSDKKVLIPIYRNYYAEIVDRYEKSILN